MRSNGPIIAHVLGYIAAHYGGPPKVAVALGREMQKHGCKVSFWATGDADDQREVKKHDLNINLYETTWPRGWFRSPPLVREITSQVASFDLLHMHGIWTYPIYAGVKIARKYNTPYLITPHGTLQPWHLNKKRLKKKVYFAFLARRTLEKAACLHAVTPCEAESFRMAGFQGPITIIPNGVNTAESTKPPDGVEAENLWPALKDRPVVLFLSRLSLEKGLDQLIPAWAQVIGQSNHNDALLVLAGPEDRGYRAVVEALVEQHALQLHVLFTGMARGWEKQALISRADVYTLPSYSEGFSISILENLAAGKPVLITPGCCFPKVVEAKAGLCVAPESDALAEALCELLEMPRSEREAMGKRGVKLVKDNYTWDRIVGKFLTVYDCVLSGKSIPLHPEPMELNAE